MRECFWLLVQISWFFLVQFSRRNWLLRRPFLRRWCCWSHASSCSWCALVVTTSLKLQAFTLKFLFIPIRRWTICRMVQNSLPIQVYLNSTTWAILIMLHYLLGLMLQHFGIQELLWQIACFSMGVNEASTDVGDILGIHCRRTRLQWLIWLMVLQRRKTWVCTSFHNQLMVRRLPLLSWRALQTDEICLLVVFLRKFVELNFHVLHLTCLGSLGEHN